MFDILENNAFRLAKRGDAEMPTGPYRLGLSIKDKRLVFDINPDTHQGQQFHLSLTPFRQMIELLGDLRKLLRDAVKNMPPSQIETIDMARRGIHNEGARILEERLDGKAEVDRTARRLFTLMCVLHFGAD